MKFVVLNGSSKGEDSMTLAYVYYLSQYYPEHDWQFIDVANRIKLLEKKEEEFNKIFNEIQSADGIIWSFGLIVLGVPSQCMRFIELIQERKKEDVFKGKYTASIASSIHFFDHLALNYIRAISEDMGMKYIDEISLYLNDITDKEQRRLLRVFFENFCDAILTEATPVNRFAQLKFYNFNFQPTKIKDKVATEGKRILVLTDSYDKKTNLSKIIDQFQDSFEEKITLLNLNDVKITGHCRGCMSCGYDYQCVYKDEFRDFYNNQVMPADIIIISGDMKGRFLSSKWKQFFDRAFFWNHRPSLANKQIGYLITGPLTQNQNLIQYLEATATARQDANFAGFVTDEIQNSEEITKSIHSFANQLVRNASQEYIHPKNFLAVGGHKIFRDEIWGRIRMIWQADHRYYRKHGKYDFPQKNLTLRFMNASIVIFSRICKPFRKKFYGMIKSMPSSRMRKMVDIIIKKKKDS